MTHTPIDFDEWGATPARAIASHSPMHHAARDVFLPAAMAVRGDGCGGGIYEGDEAMTNLETYALALLVEECGEVVQLIGKAGRFGIDTPGIKDPLTNIVDMTATPRSLLPKELGDISAAISYCVERGVIDGRVFDIAYEKKFAKLMDEKSVDNLGRRLAP